MCMYLYIYIMSEFIYQIYKYQNIPNFGMQAVHFEKYVFMTSVKYLEFGT